MDVINNCSKNVQDDNKENKEVDKRGKLRRRIDLPLILISFMLLFTAGILLFDNLLNPADAKTVVYYKTSDNSTYLQATESQYTEEVVQSVVFPININTAAAEDFIALDGIGEAKAKAIITYREQNGGFKSIEEIKNVSGIGDSTYNKIKDYITVQ